MQRGYYRGFGFQGKGSFSLDYVDKFLRTVLLTDRPDMLEKMYATIPFVRNVVSFLVDIAFSQGLNLETNQVEIEAVNELSTIVNNHPLIEVFSDAIAKGFLYGGAWLLVDHNGNFEEKLDINDVKPGDDLTFHAYTRYDLVPEGNLVLGNQTTADFYKVRGIFSIPRDNFILFKGMPAEGWLKQGLHGYGLSLLENAFPIIMNWISGQQNAAEMLKKINQTFFFLNDYSSVSEDDDKMAKLEEAIQRQDNNDALVLSKDDKVEIKERNLQGLEVVDVINQKALCAVLGYPRVFLFGESQTNLSATSQDIKAMEIIVSKQIGRKYLGKLTNLIKLIGKVTQGIDYKDLRVSFNPIQPPSKKEEIELLSSLSGSLSNFVMSGIITQEEARNILKEYKII